jgi:hypothetical protein
MLKPDPAVLAWIEECYDKGEPPKAMWQRPSYAQLPNCNWCIHREHDFQCVDCECMCNSSHQRLDDTWRPTNQYTQAWQIAKAMDVLGCDGWVARFIHGVGIQLKPYGRKSDIKKVLYGEAS